MATLVDSDPSPTFPLRAAGIDANYRSLADVGVDWEFLDERGLEDDPDGVIIFTDSVGQQFRILVISLEVVLCVAVPAGFDPRRLVLTEVPDADARVVVEHLDGEVHRALRLEAAGNSQGRALSSADIAEIRPQWERLGKPSSLPWEQFDLAWFESVDPSPPLGLGEMIHAVLPRGRARRSR
jgi:hypothetical protein